MKKLKLFVAVLLLGLIWSPSIYAAPEKKDQDHGHHHKLIDCDKAEELKEQGYSKQDIFMGAMLAKKADKNIDEVFTLFKENKSWEKTAEQLGIDMEEFKQIDSMRKWEEFVKEHEDEVTDYLAKYAGKKSDEIEEYIEDELPLRFLIGAAALAKLSDKKLDDIITYKKDGKSFHDIMEELKVSKEDLHKELNKFKEDVQKEIDMEKDD